MKKSERKKLSSNAIGTVQKFDKTSQQNS